MLPLLRSVKKALGEILQRRSVAVEVAALDKVRLQAGGAPLGHLAAMGLPGHFSLEVWDPRHFGMYQWLATWQGWTRQVRTSHFLAFSTCRTGSWERFLPDVRAPGTEYGLLSQRAIAGSGLHSHVCLSLTGMLKIEMYDSTPFPRMLTEPQFHKT